MHPPFTPLIPSLPSPTHLPPLAGQGLYDPQASWVPKTIGVLTFLGTLAWTIWGNRLVARIKGLMAIAQIAAMVPKDRAVADAVPDVRVTPAADTTVVVVPK